MNEIVVGIMQESFTINPVKNYEIIRNHLINSYREADIVILPEYSMINLLGGISPEETYSRAEILDDSIFISKLADLAGRLDTYILAHMIEKSEEKPKSYSSSIFIEPSGKTSRVYRKIHLFNAYGYRESDYLLPGKEPSLGLISRDKPFFVAICYDIRFPELFRKYAYRGAYGVFLQAGWVRGPLKEEILDFLGSSRSHENTMYLIIANQTGEQYTGRSGVFNPYGYKEFDLGFHKKYAEHRIDLSLVDEARRDIPVVKHSMDRWSIDLRGRKL